MPETHYFESYDIPVGIGALKELQGILRAAGVFLSTGNEDERYNVLTYRRQKAHHDKATYALLDRNALNDVLALVRPAVEGRIEKCGERGRIGAAMMVFLQSANVLIEPNIALYENPAEADREAHLFRQADNVAPEVYSRLALGQIDYLPPDCVPSPATPVPKVNFYQPIKNTQKFRIAALKIAELDLTALACAEKMRRFLQWSHDDFYFLAVPTLLAATHFSPHRKSSILQSLRSPERKRALEGIQNAVWDMITIQQWGKNVSRQSEEKRIWLLCSRDEALKRIAGILHCDSKSPQESIRTIFGEWWGAKEGGELASLATSLQENLDHPTRRANQVVEEGYLRNLGSDLENRILAWSPA